MAASLGLWVSAPRAARPALGELLEAWRGAGVDVQTEWHGEMAAPDMGDAVTRAAKAPDAALVIGAPRRAPARVLPGPLATARDGARVPLAWLPARDAASLRRFAHAAARVQRRGGRARGVALLGQWLPQYLHVTDRMRHLADAIGVRAFRWSSDALTREQLVAALGCGLGLGLYVGHGRPVGWAGYHGVRAHHFEQAASLSSQPLGAMLSLCCRTASRRRVGLSYAEALALQGVAAASFGAVTDTLHSDNTRWAVGVCEALAAGATRVGELIARAAPVSPTALGAYRLIGDPLAPLASDAAALRRAARVRTWE